MKKKTRFLALAICISFLLSLCACRAEKAEKTLPALQTIPAADEASAPEAPAIETLAAGGYFEPRARQELSFREMAAEEIPYEAFIPYAQALETAAASKSREAFHRACTQAEKMLLDIDTAASLLELESDRDAGDETRSKRADRQAEAYADAADLYQKTLHKIALGENAAMLNKEFETWQVELFRSYDETSSSQALALSEQEAQLVSQYALLCAQEEMDVDAAAEIYLELVDVRGKTAELASAPSYADYVYSARYSRDYTPSDAQKIWKTAKEDFAPLLNRYSDALLQALRESGAADRTDVSEERILRALSYGAARMSPEINEAAEYLLSHELYDISDSERKLSIGYTAYLYSYEVPYIFNCPYGTFDDYTDLFHEFGHWLSGYYHGSDALYGVTDYDLSELQSQGMEVMFLQFYDDLFAEDAELFRAQVLLNLVYSVVVGAMYDEFQQRVYAEPGLSAERLSEMFREVYESYGFEVYDGCEYEWTQVVHNFQQPFYYISYAVSAIPALELYVQSTESPNDAMDTYLRVAAMSDEDFFLTDALREAGFSNSMKSPIGDVIAQELENSGAFGIF